jgi:molybdopterin molybdotransferase
MVDSHSSATKPALGRQALEFGEARRFVIDAVRDLAGQRPAQNVALLEAYGRVLAGAIRADRDYPTLERSLRDGFAVRAEDVPGVLKLHGEVRAGDTGRAPLGEGEAVEIMTGAPVPPGADAVIMVEQALRLPDGSVQIGVAAGVGQHINKQGAEASMDSVLLPAGLKLDASHIATLAMTGYAEVPVFTRPRVAILATGDEIVAVEEKPAPHQIRNSNSYMLAALVAATGGSATILPVAGDRTDLLEPLLALGLTHDLLIVSGGVSAGKYDLVKPTLRTLGVDFEFERVRVQPGQPTAFGTRNRIPVFGLPGNPGSTLITYQLFARPALELLAGIANPLQPFLSAHFSKPFKHKLGLTRFLPAHLAEDGESLEHIPWQGSSDIPALARANVFLIADSDRESWDVGDSIRVMLKP